MTFEEWWEEERVGYSREEELSRALYVDEWKVTQMLKEAYEAGYEAGYEYGWGENDILSQTTEAANRG